MQWTPNLAYVVGLLASDGCLSKDGRHIDFTSKDIELIQTFTSILKLKNKIGTKNGGYGQSKIYYRIQFGNIKLYKFLSNIGLTPNKSKTLGELSIPEKFFADFLRGTFDGDGFTYSYWDKRWKSSYMLYTGFVSASEIFVYWLKNSIQKQYNITGTIGKLVNGGYQLKYAKKNSMALLDTMYYKNDLPCLQRKRSKIVASLAIIDTLNKREW